MQSCMNIKDSQDQVLVSSYISPKLVAFLEEETRDKAFEVLVNLLDKECLLKDRRSFYEALLERESVVSTGIGMGVAVPHVKLRDYEEFFIVIGIHSKGILWENIDKTPVRLIFMIGGPDNKQTAYLQLLSKLTLALKDDERREKMLQIKEKAQIISLFNGF